MSVAATAAFDRHCYQCDKTAAREDASTCPSCNGALSLRALAEAKADLFAQAPRDQWHYAPLLPLDDPGAAVSLGEGATPLLDAPQLSHTLGHAVTIKNEATNPTGSFKDRQVSVGISHARARGYTTVAVVSSGNVARAAAAYAAKAGMRAVVFLHAHASATKVAAAQAYGARVIRVNSPSAHAVFQLCIHACERFGWYHLSTAGIYAPYNVEGAKTIAYELYYQTNGDLPEWIVLPVGGGGLLGGVWRGFLDLQRLGLIDTLPRLAGIQAAGCAPLVRAIDENLSAEQSNSRPWRDPKTVAGGLADDILFDGHTVLPAIRATQGLALAVTDAELLDAQRGLAQSEGLLCEPSSAVVFAALSRLGLVESDRVCCVLTGAGLNDQDALPQAKDPLLTIDATTDALDRCEFFGADE